MLTLWAQQEAFVEEGVLAAGARVATAVRAPGFYLYKTALLFDLAPYYPHPVKIDFFTAKYPGAAVFLATGDKAALYYIGVSYALTDRRAEAVESLRKAEGLGLREATEALRQMGEE